jgi:hypothetical protein
VIPPVGGDTCFASLEQAYLALSPGMKTLLEGLTGIHCGKGVFGINAATTRLGLRTDNAKAIEELETEHPVICAHPATGKRYVFVSSVLQRFKGFTEAETSPSSTTSGARHRPESRAACVGGRDADHVGQSLRAAYGDQRLFGLSPRDIPHDGRGSRAAGSAG